MRPLREIIYTAFRLAQVAEQGEYDIGEDKETEAINALQSLVASWATDGLLDPFCTIETFAITEYKASYTIGPDADFNTAMPSSIDDIYVNRSNLDYCVRPCTRSEYFMIQNKNKQAQTPSLFYFHFNFPVSTIYFYPIPTGISSITIASKKIYQWISYNNIDYPVPLPDEFLDALQFNLAIALAAQYAIEATPTVIANAERSLKNLFKLNRKPAGSIQYDLPASPYRRYSNFPI